MYCWHCLAPFPESASLFKYALETGAVVDVCGTCILYFLDRSKPAEQEDIFADLEIDLSFEGSGDDLEAEQPPFYNPNTNDAAFFSDLTTGSGVRFEDVHAFSTATVLSPPPPPDNGPFAKVTLGYSTKPHAISKSETAEQRREMGQNMAVLTMAKPAKAKRVERLSDAPPPLAVTEPVPALPRGNAERLAEPLARPDLKRYNATLVLQRFARKINTRQRMEIALALFNGWRNHRNLARLDRLGELLGAAVSAARERRRLQLLLSAEKYGQRRARLAIASFVSSKLLFWKARNAVHERTRPEPKKRRVSTACLNCGKVEETPGRMRYGPAGLNTLCNACGVRWSRKKPL